METTVFTPAQRYMLEMMSYVKTEEELLELRQLVAEHFAHKAADEMDRLWDEGRWNNEKNEAVLGCQ